ncbi:MAG: hypothetical protein BRD57_06540, partial [Proteobacteria bacterium SW_6_67_9]
GVGRVLIRTMSNAGYDEEYSAALTSASATIGPIFPPSVPLIIYGIIAEVSVLQLLLAGALFFKLGHAVEFVDRLLQRLHALLIASGFGLSELLLQVLAPVLVALAGELGLTTLKLEQLFLQRLQGVFRRRAHLVELLLGAFNRTPHARQALVTE